MNKKYIKDSHSNAVLSADSSALRRARAEKKRRLEAMNREKSLEQRIEALEKQVQALINNNKIEEV